MSKLRQVIQEELSNILQSVEQTEQEIESRNRRDRLEKREKESGDRWYKNESGSGDVKDKLRQIVAEEYKTLRDDPETSIEHRSGLRDFEVPDGTSGRWYTDNSGNVDSKKIEEAAKLLTKKTLIQKKLDKLTQ